MNEDHLRDLAEALNSEDKAIKALIVDELETLRPELEKAEADAANRLREAITALQIPESQIKDIEAEISVAEAKVSEFREQVNSPSLHSRVEAGRWLTEWQSELDKLRNKRNQVQDALQLDEKNAARNALREAQNALAGFELNLKIPYAGHGRRTAAYRGFRVGFGHLVPILLAGDRENPEFDAAMDLMDSLALASGYRTDHLPADSEAYRRHWDAIRDAANPPESAPTGREVMDADLTALENTARNASRSPSRIEDYRSPL